MVTRLPFEGCKLFVSFCLSAQKMNHLFFWVEGGVWETLLTPTNTISCTRATMVTMTLREKKRGLQPTAEVQNLTDLALCQVLRLLFGLLPGRKLVIALRTPTKFPA